MMYETTEMVNHHTIRIGMENFISKYKEELTLEIQNPKNFILNLNKTNNAWERNIKPNLTVDSCREAKSKLRGSSRAKFHQRGGM